MTAGGGIRICLVEDDPILGEALLGRLAHEGFEAELRTTGAGGIARITSEPTDLVVCDIRLPDMSGEDLYVELQRAGIDVPVLFVTGYGTIEQAVRLLHRGALDYVTKPIDMERMLDRIRTAVVHRQTPIADDALGVSSAMRLIRKTLVRLIPHPEMVVLVRGESGTGKEVIARLIHALACPHSPFEAVNCAAVPEDLVASILFGHEKGAFTGADRKFSGAFRRAAGGVLFLDEIGDMPLRTQVQLLRVIEERRFQPLGSETSVPFDCRIVCATHQDLEEKIARGEFREDLFFRLGVVTIEIPALRDRRDDIFWLAAGFLAENAARANREPLSLAEDARRALLEYHWPGNVRELKNVIDRACLFCDGDVIDARALGLPEAGVRGLRDTLESYEANRIERELAAHDGRIQETAHALGISRKSLWQKMKKLGIGR